MLVAAALNWIDDPIGLLDDRPVPTAQIWRSVLAAAAGPRCDELLVVHPDDWSRLRVDRLVRAAGPVAARVEAVARGQWAGPQRRGRARYWAPALVVALVAGAAAVQGDRPDGRPQPAVVSLVEGPVAVLIPAEWTIERRTDGPGTPRVRVGSPTDPEAALHITWSYAPQTTLADVAETLRRAAAAEPAGVFDFVPGEPGARPAVTYREVRPGRVVRWAVLIDGSTRIAVGCQSAPGREAGIRAACEQAVRSARDLTRPF